MVSQRSGVRSILGLLCTALLVAAVLSPWWRITIATESGSQSITAYPYTLRGERLLDLIRSSGEYLGPLRVSREMKLHTAALVTGALLCFLGAILRGRWAGLVLAASGLIVLLDVFKFYERMRELGETHYGFPVQGQFIITNGLGSFYLTNQLLTGFYLALLSGILALLSGVLLTLLRHRGASAGAAG
jgi:hypothetical protein